LAKCGGDENTYVDYIVDYPLDELVMDVGEMRRTKRSELGIPHNALVLCRHGGHGTFDIGLVRDNLATMVEQHANLHVVLMNTARLAQGHQRIHEVVGSSDVAGKARFFASCDAMLHARSDGESFGLAVGEFALRNKPIITFNGPGGYYRAHLQILGDRGLYYHDLSSLSALLGALVNEGVPAREDWNVYKQYSREVIMNKFETVFVNPALKWWEEVRRKGIKDVGDIDYDELPPGLDNRCDCNCGLNT